MSQEKYYEGTHKPLPEYTKNDGETTYLKSIRIPDNELENWDPKKIHEFLSGNMENETIEKLKHKLSIYHKLFEMIIAKYGARLPDDIQNYILNHKEFDEEEE